MRRDYSDDGAAPSEPTVSDELRRLLSYCTGERPWLEDSDRPARAMRVAEYRQSRGGSTRGPGQHGALGAWSTRGTPVAAGRRRPRARRDWGRAGPAAPARSSRYGLARGPARRHAAARGSRPALRAGRLRHEGRHRPGDPRAQGSSPAGFRSAAPDGAAAHERRGNRERRLEARRSRRRRTAAPPCSCSSRRSRAVTRRRAERASVNTGSRRMASPPTLASSRNAAPAPLPKLRTRCSRLRACRISSGASR